MYARMLNIVVLCLAVSCSAPQPAVDAEGCEPETSCEITGKLVVEGPWLASLDLTDYCYALALPDSFFDEAEAWNGARVTVIGDAFSQPVAPSGSVSYAYEVKGMRVRTNLCDVALTVDEIRDMNNAVLWQKSP